MRALEKPTYRPGDVAICDNLSAKARRTLTVDQLERLRPRLQGDPDFDARLGQMADASTETAIGVARDLLIRDSEKRLAPVLLRVTMTSGQVRILDRPGGVGAVPMATPSLDRCRQAEFDRGPQLRVGRVAGQLGRLLGRLVS